MKKYLLILTLLLIHCPGVSHAAGVELQFEQANEHFSRGEYQEAIPIYLDILEQSGYSAPVLFNLANSYALTGHPGFAIVQYERALMLAPGDADIAGNLQLVRSANGLFPTEPSHWQRVVNLFNLNQWAVMTIVTLIIFTIAAVAGLLGRLANITALSVCCISLLFLVVSLLSLNSHYLEWDSAIVIKNGRLQISPFDGAASLGALKEGTRVYVKKQHGNYLYVVDDAHHKGWLNQHELVYLIPR